MILLADSEGPDQTARMRRLIWAFAVCICPKTGFHMARPNACLQYAYKGTGHTIREADLSKLFCPRSEKGSILKA